MRKLLLIFLAALCCDLALLLWCLAPRPDLEVYFFDVGEGDSELISWNNGAKILIDGGRAGRLGAELGRALGPAERRIDLMLLTHCQVDHLGGLKEVVERYEISVFAYNGCIDNPPEWALLKEELDKRGVRLVALTSGDRLRIGESEIKILSPLPNLRPTVSDENGRVITFLLKGFGQSFLFMSDAPPELETKVAAEIGSAVDVLKVSHHGSRFSSTGNFLAAVRPRLSVIEVGANSYGHPAAEALGRLGLYGSVYRTDLSGTIRVFLDSGILHVFSARTPGG